jgi:alpha-2-macroglobulin
MLGFFKKRWVWVTALFLVINILGLIKIISVLEDRRPYQRRHKLAFLSSVSGNVRQLIWPAKKVVEKVLQDEMRVTFIRSRSYELKTSIEIGLSRSVDLSAIKGFIEISPQVDFIVEKRHYGLILSGDFKPGQAYQVEVLRGMPSEKGVLVRESVKSEVVMPDYGPTMRFKTEGMYVSLEGNQNIPIEVTNIDDIKVYIHRVYDNNIVYLLNNKGYYSIPDDIGIDVDERSFSINPQRNKPTEFLLDLKGLIQKDSRGIFFMRVIEPDSGYYWSGVSKIILTSDIGMVVKKSEKDMFVWLNSLSSNENIEGASVKVFTKTNQQILEGTSDGNGFVYFKDVDWSGDRKPFVLTASKENDQSFIELEKCILSETDFKTEGRPYISSGYEGFLYTDRGIFRPGETVNVKAVLRGPMQDMPESFPVVFEITRPDGREFSKVHGVLSGFGTVGVNINIPDYALTGAYTANLMIPGSKEKIGSVQFSVEEFMPDRLKVSITTDDKSFKLGDVFSVKVKAEEFFGAPAEGRNIEVFYRLRPHEIKPDGFKGYSFTDTTKSYTPRTVSFGQRASDKNGIAGFALELPSDVLPPSGLVCEIRAVVKEIGGRAVTTYTERPVESYPYYIGIRQAKEGHIALGQEGVFEYVVVSADGEKIDAPELEVSIYKIVWNNILKKDDTGSYRYISESTEELVRTQALKKGESAYSFTPNLWGDYIIRINAKEKPAHSASLKFYCAYSGYMPWAMQRPDRLELKFDKPYYSVGDTAILTVQSPFKGKALITVSKDKIITSSIVDLENQVQKIPILIEEDYTPNAYCAVTVIRPVDPKQDWISYRAYGITPIGIDNKANKLSIDISSPASTMPKEKIKLDIEVKDSQGLPKQAEVSLALVDEGILSLTNFKTPNPFEFFYGQRGNSIVTSDIYSLLIPEFGQEKIGADSTPSGDRAPYDPSRRLNPISAQRVKPVVLSKSNIITDADGKASAEFIIPQFSGSLRIMAVVVADKGFASSQGALKVVEPLMIKPNLPRVLSTNDEFIVPVSVFNSIGKDADVNISLITSDGFSFKSDKSFNINIQNAKEKAVSFKLRAPNTPQKAVITINAKGQGHESSVVTELAVRPPVPFTSLMGSGVIKTPADTSIKIPGAWLKGTERANLIITSLPALQFAGGLKYLMEYPYGCVEQVTSCVFPLLYLKDVASIVAPDKYSHAQIDSYIQEGITRILAMQTFSGGFSTWPGYNHAYHWGSIYATEFLVEASNAGYVVPVLSRNVALDYCEKILSDQSNEHSLELKAYSCYVLSKAGRLKASWIRRLQEVQDKLPAHSRLHLAASLFSLGDRKAVEDILGKGMPDKKIERETGDTLNSYTKVNAIALSIYMDIDPENQMVPVLVKRLEGSMENGQWGTTQDNAMALLALGKYANYYKNQDIDYTGKVLVDGKIIAEFDSKAELILTDSSLAGKDIKVSVSGKGDAYYYWLSEGITIAETVEEKDQGMQVRRSFLTRDGKALDADSIKQGDVIVVEIMLSSALAYKNVVVEDLLPACFEIENPRIATAEKIDWIQDGLLSAEHVDVRDDRLIVFTDLKGEEKEYYRYVVRAVTRGRFILPAINAYCMYDPSIMSISGQGHVEVD